MKLVTDWKDAPKWFSMWAMAIFTGTTGTWAIMPATWQSIVLSVIPPNVLVGSVCAIGLLGMVGRIIDQGLKPQEQRT